MKEQNLISIIQAFKLLPEDLKEQYFKLFQSKPKENEINDLDSLKNELWNVGEQIEVFDKFFFGYNIPQISKEFDLLRFGKDYIINIELKSNNTGEKINKQIIRNQYYLSFLNKKVFVFTYVSEDNKLYTFDESQQLISISFKYLFNLLAKQETIEILNIDNLFNPSNYLVSPFNSTDEFIAGRYFLTAHQEEIKSQCLKLLGQPGANFISICGKAGTGKTLLTFDLVKHLMSKNQRVLIIHCGNLNNGHLKLRDEYDWEILPIKRWNEVSFENYELIVLDETQRIFPPQLKEIINTIKNENGNCIFSYDKNQCLRIWEVKNNIAQIISDKTNSKLFVLTDKIRTNKEIASFISALFDKNKSIDKINRKNIDINFFGTAAEAKKYLRSMRDGKWKIINYTPSNIIKYPYEDFSVISEDNAHGVIGQEFDNVIAVIDDYFCYKEEKLTIKNYAHQPYYHPPKMLFQIMTRTRRRLNLVVINNNEILERILSILSNSR